MSTTDTVSARLEVAARLAAEHGTRWGYDVAVAEYVLGLPIADADLFVSTVDLLDAVQAQIDAGGAA